jgi:hypothetical protein
MLGDLQSRDDVVMVQSLLLAGSEQSGNLQNILDLTTIHVHPRKVIELVLCDGVLLC